MSDSLYKPRTPIVQSFREVFDELPDSDPIRMEVLRNARAIFQGANSRKSFPGQHGFSLSMAVDLYLALVLFNEGVTQEYVERGL